MFDFANCVCRTPMHPKERRNSARLHRPNARSRNRVCCRWKPRGNHRCGERQTRIGRFQFLELGGEPTRACLTIRLRLREISYNGVGHRNFLKHERPSESEKLAMPSAACPDFTLPCQLAFSCTDELLCCRRGKVVLPLPFSLTRLFSPQCSEYNRVAGSMKHIGI